MPTSALPSLSTVVIHVTASRHFSFAGFVILLYDHLLTLGDEIELIWSQPISVVSGIFVVAPAVLAIDIYDKGGLTRHVSRNFCRAWVLIEGYLNLLLLAAIHAIMLMRVHALWGNQPRLRRFLIMAFVLYFAASFVILTVGLLETARTIAFEELLIHACWTLIPKYLWSVWIPALVLESVIFALTAVRAWQYSADGMRIPVVHALWRDGFQYFIGIMICTFFPMLVWSIAPPTLVALPKYGTMALINVLGFRIVLNLRSYCANPTNLTTFQEYELQDQQTRAGYTDLQRVVRVGGYDGSAT